MTYAKPPAPPSPAQPRQPAGMGIWIGIMATILALGIAVTLSVGLLALSYARATAPVLATTSETAPTAPTTNTPSLGATAEPSVTQRLRDNPSGALSRGAAFLLMLLLVFVVGQLGLRFTDHPAVLGVGIACGWGFAILAALLGIGGALRFTLTSDTSILEYVSYVALIVLNLIMAAMLAAVGRLPSVCRGFAMLMAIVAGAHLLLTLFGSGLRFDLHFLGNFVYLLILVIAVGGLLYATGLIAQLFPQTKRA